MTDYDPMSAGRFRVGVRTIEAADSHRGRTFPCELWYPAGSAEPGPPCDRRLEEPAAAASPGQQPLVIFSHFSGGGRRTATFLTTHLASHGYVVAAMDHSEIVAPELAPAAGETLSDRRARIDAVIASRVPDVRFLLGHLLERQGVGELADISLDPDLIGVAGHSFGGWTALAVPEQEERVRAVVAMAPGGASQPVPGVLPLKLAFGWDRAAPVLILAGDRDVPIPLAGVQEVFERAPAPKRLFVLGQADHQHFADDVEASHEAVRAMKLPGEAAWMSAAMAPATALCSGALAHLFSRSLTLAHFDEALRGEKAAGEFLENQAGQALRDRGVPVASAAS